MFFAAGAPQEVEFQRATIMVFCDIVGVEVPIFAAFVDFFEGPQPASHMDTVHIAIIDSYT